MVETTAAQDSAFERWAGGFRLSESATLDTVLGLFGSPDSLITVATPNRYDSAQIDSVVAMVYNPGFRVSLYRVTGGPAFISHVTVTSNEFLHTGAVRIGMPSLEIRELFGPAALEVDGKAYYDCGTCSDAGRTVSFEVVAGRLMAVSFAYYTG